jgi:uncharacterized membrane protein
MNKQEFIANLQAKLYGLPKQDTQERIDFYIEMINDLMEDGLSEDEAVLKIGSVDEIATQILTDIPLTKIAKERIKPKRRIRAWEIVLLALGSPIWLSLAIAAVAVILSLYAVLWSVIISIWAVFGSLVACSIGGVAASIIFAVSGNGLSGIVMIGASVVCAGLSIFTFFGCKAATNAVILLTKKMLWVLKNILLERRAHNE